MTGATYWAILAFIAVVPVACTTTAIVPCDSDVTPTRLAFKRYRDPDGVFSFEMPKDWVVGPLAHITDTHIGRERGRCPYVNHPPPPAVTVRFTSWEPHRSSSDTDTLWWAASVGSRIPEEYRVFEETETVAAGLPALRIVSKRPPNLLFNLLTQYFPDVTRVQTLILWEGTRYEVAMETRDGILENSRTIFNHVLSTLQLSRVGKNGVASTSKAPGPSASGGREPAPEVQICVARPAAAVGQWQVHLSFVASVPMSFELPPSWTVEVGGWSLKRASGPVVLPAGCTSRVQRGVMGSGNTITMYDHRASGVELYWERFMLAGTPFGVPKVVEKKQVTVMGVPGQTWILKRRSLEWATTGNEYTSDVMIHTVFSLNHRQYEWEMWTTDEQLHDSLAIFARVVESLRVPTSVGINPRLLSTPSGR